MFLLNDALVGERRPSSIGNSNRLPAALRPCNGIKPFIRSFTGETNAPRSTIAVAIRTKGKMQRDVQYQEIALNVARRIFSAMWNAWNDVKNTLGWDKIYQGIATSCSLYYLNEEVYILSSKCYQFFINIFRSCFLLFDLPRAVILPSQSVVNFTSRCLRCVIRAQSECKITKFWEVRLKDNEHSRETLQYIEFHSANISWTPSYRIILVLY